MKGPATSVVVLTLIASSVSAFMVWAMHPLWIKMLTHVGVTSETLLSPPVTPFVAVAAVAFVALLVTDHDGLTRTESSTSHGSARFAETSELRSDGHGTAGVVLGMEDTAELVKVPAWMTLTGKPSWKLKKAAPLVCTEHLHVLVEGPTGSGKDVSVVVPTLLTDFARSYVVLDPKGQAYNQTAGCRSAYSVVFRFAPSETGSARCNPLMTIPIGTDDEVRSAKKIANILAGSTAKEDTTARIYLQSCETLLTCAIIHAIHQPDPSHRNLPWVLDLLNDPTKTELDVIATITAKQPPGSSGVMNSLRRFAADKRMVQGMFTTSMDVLGFCAMPQVRAAISGSDFLPSDLSQRDKPMSLYLVIPFADADVLRPLARLMLATLLNHHGLERKRDTTYMLNEFPSLGYIPAVARGIGELREYGVQLVLFIQSEGQLFDDSSYGKAGARTLIDNCLARVTLGVNGYDSAEAASKRFGKATLIRPRHTQAVSKKSLIETTVTNTRGEGEQARELMTPDEIRATPAHWIWIELPILRPYRAVRAVYYAHPEMLRRSKIPAPKVAA